MKLLSFLFFVIIIATPLTYSQKAVNVKGVGKVRIERDMTEQQAKILAEQQAIINAIDSEFGTYVEQESGIRVKDGQIFYDIIGTTRVKGEWVSTSSIDFWVEVEEAKTELRNDVIKWINCEVRGKAKPLSTRTGVEIKTLDDVYADYPVTDFYNGENLYLWFKCAGDGWLSVFLYDSKIVYRLLPYSKEGSLNAFPVQGDKPYVFFDRQTNSFSSEGHQKDEIVLVTDLPEELNVLYIVYSPFEFQKPILEDMKVTTDDFIQPRSLSKAEFDKWLGNLRTSDNYLQVKTLNINIQTNR